MSDEVKSPEAAEAQQATAEASKVAGKYLTFKLADEEYGLEILKVKEIFGLMNITRVPRTPDHIKGVINLRGKVIPVMDLRAKFMMEQTENTEETCIIVVEVNRKDKAVTMGIIVDSVSEVLDIPPEAIENAPSFGTSVETDFILGMGKVGDKVTILLDIIKILDIQAAEEITAAVQ